MGQPARVSRTRMHIGRSHAIWARRQLLFAMPEHAELLLKSELYEVGGFRWFLVAELSENLIAEAAKQLQELKPVSLPLALSSVPPEGGLLVSVASTYADEQWLADEPMSITQLNDMLALSSTRPPEGVLSYWHAGDEYEFVSLRELSEDEMSAVREAAGRINVPLRRFVTAEDVPQVGVGNLLTTRHSKSLPATLKVQLERDEDGWRDFCCGSVASLPAASPLLPEKSACLIDCSMQDQVTLSELLCLYEVVHVIPGRLGSTTGGCWGLSVEDVQKLVGMGRLRLVLPSGVQAYDTRALSAAAEVSPEALVLSRRLAIRTIESGRSKNPLLHGPFSSDMKVAMLGVMGSVLPTEIAKAMLRAYSQALSKQQLLLAMQGAEAFHALSMGSILGAAMTGLRDNAPELELMTAGAAVEWSLGLKASYIPRSFDGYDETRNATLVARALGRTHRYDLAGVPERMRTIVDGLLAVSDLSPVEVATSLNTAQRKRFYQVSRKLMSGMDAPGELEEAVEALNLETRAFERKSRYLKLWKIDVPLVGAAAKPLNDALDAGVFPFASVFAAWFYAVLKEKVPPIIKREMSDLAHALAGGLMGTAVDAVIVARTRGALQSRH